MEFWSNGIMHEGEVFVPFRAVSVILKESSTEEFQF